MKSTHTEILSAFFDGERVDLALLAAALEDAEARRALVDFARLRQATGIDDAPLPTGLERPRTLGSERRLLRWSTAAAVLLLAFIAGLLTPLGGARTGAGSPPQPARVEKFEPGVDWDPGD